MQVQTRYSPDDFEMVLLDEEPEPGEKGARAEVGPLELRRDAEPPLRKFRALRS